MQIHIQAYTSLKKISGCLVSCILSNGEVIKYHKFISVVVIELSVRCPNTGPEDRLDPLYTPLIGSHNMTVLYQNLCYIEVYHMTLLLIS